jgi:hypothetical protein
VRTVPKRALYYPEWGIADPALLFESLLYWDRIACIVPYSGFRPAAGGADAEILRASKELHEKFVTGLLPSPEQQQAAHGRIAALIDQPAPEWYRPENLRTEQKTLISALKMTKQTEELLETHGWIGSVPSGQERLHEISIAATDLVLAAIVEEFTSETLAPFTGDPMAYAATCNALLQELQAIKGLAPDGEGERVAVGDRGGDALLVTSFLRLGVPRGQVTARMLNRLSHLRDDSDFEGQRTQFCEKVDDFVAQIRGAPDAERVLVYDTWKHDLTRERQALQRDLRRAGLDTIIEKESLVGLFITGGTGALAASALGPIGLAIGIGLVGARMAVAWRKRRHQVTQEHWSSYLFSLERPRFSVG